MHRICLSFLIYFCTVNFCFAAPCYGTRMPDNQQFTVGLQTHSVLERDLIDQNGEMSSLQNFVLISYGILDWLCLDMKGGVGNIKQQSPGVERIDYSAYLGGGYGFRMRLYEYEKTKIVFGFQHISIHPHKTHKNGIKRKAVSDDWQFSLLASHDFPIITPYLGTRWSRMDYILWINGERSRIKSDLTKSIGLVIGADIPIDDRIWLNLEGNFFDAEAFAVSLNFNF